MSVRPLIAGLVLVLSIIVVGPLSTPVAAHHCDPEQPPCEGDAGTWVKHVVNTLTCPVKRLLGNEC